MIVPESNHYGSIVLTSDLRAEWLPLADDFTHFSEQQHGGYVKTQRLLVMVVTLLGVMLTSGFAQTARVKVNVPFRFSIGDKALAAGVYFLSSEHDRILIQNSEGIGLAMAMVNGVSGHSTARNGEVVFRCYRDQCFLSQLWEPEKQNGHQLMRTRQEQEVAKREPETYFALAGTAWGK